MSKNPESVAEDRRLIPDTKDTPIRFRAPPMDVIRAAMAKEPEEILFRMLGIEREREFYTAWRIKVFSSENECLDIKVIDFLLSALRDLNATEFFIHGRLYVLDLKSDEAMLDHKKNLSNPRPTLMARPAYIWDDRIPEEPADSEKTPPQGAISRTWMNISETVAYGQPVQIPLFEILSYFKEPLATYIDPEGEMAAKISNRE